MKKGLKNFIIGYLILSAFFVQAGRGFRNSPNTPARPHIPLEIRSENTAYELNPIFQKAILTAKRMFREYRGISYSIEYDIIKSIAHGHFKTLNGPLNEDWSKNGASKRAIQFLELFVEYAETLSVPQAFDEALMALGLMNPARIGLGRQRIYNYFIDRALPQFFADKEIESRSRPLNRPAIMHQ